MNRYVAILLKQFGGQQDEYVLIASTIHQLLFGPRVNALSDINAHGVGDSLP
jgi:hypothetical protein